MAHLEIWGCYYLTKLPFPKPICLPLVSLKSHTVISSYSSRTTLTQTFVNPKSSEPIPELRYRFPLYDGVSVVGFVCTINNNRVIRGVVKEREEARQTYQAAVDRGQTAGLLERDLDSGDVFTTTVGNVPAGAEIKVEITYLGELKHDAEADGIRLTIPTSIATRYGPCTTLDRPANVSDKGGIQVSVEVQNFMTMDGGVFVKKVESTSHKSQMEFMPAADGGGSPSLSAKMTIDAFTLDRDVVVIVVPSKPTAPVAVLEKHPTIPDQRALMTSFVPRFNLPSARPEIVFVCDRSGSMDSGNRIPNLKAALQLFLKSLPVGVKFNIVSFGWSHSFLFEKSESYSQASLEKAMRHVDTFDASYGGTEIGRPLEETFNRRFRDMDLEVFLLTDGLVSYPEALCAKVDEHVRESKGAIRLFTLGIGNEVSHALTEGLARAGNGFSQAVSDDEKMNAKVMRMLKAALSPHMTDFKLEVKYGPGGAEVKGTKARGPTGTKAHPDDEDSDEFELIEKVQDALVISVDEAEEKEKSDEKKQPSPAAAQPMSLFSADVDPDADFDADIEMKVAASQPVKGMGTGTEPKKYAHVPAVPAPKLLQAPYDIPNMFNFSRMSIYLLLDPSSSSRTPTSVIIRGALRGAGATGGTQAPLELEIPVSVLPAPAETVHQLAARKAVGELEEGHGWIHQAKDASDGKMLLSEKCPGRFSDMVEREAVRLGVQFQVGGKWCSFVAVDESEDNKATEVKKAKITTQAAAEKQKPSFPLNTWQSQQQAPHPMLSQFQPVSMMMMSSSPPGGRAYGAPVARIGAMPTGMRSAAMPAPAPAPAPVPFSSAGPPPPRPTRSAKKSAAAPMGMGSGFGSGAFRMFGGGGFGQASGPATGSGAVPPPPPPTGGLLAGAGAPQSVSYSTANFDAEFAATPMSMAKADYTPPIDDGVRMQFGRFEERKREMSKEKSASAPAAEPPKGRSRSARDVVNEEAADDLMMDVEEEDLEGAAAPEPEMKVDASDPLAALVAMQAFEGFWSWNASLYAVLGTSEAQIRDAFAKVGLDAATAKGKMAATACVVTFFRTRLAGARDEWEMMVDKALEWLGRQGGAVNSAVVFDAAISLF